MREGLAREFPEAVRAATWTRGRIARRLELRDEPVLWVTISAIGAAFLVSAVAQGLAGLTVDALQAFKSPMPLFTLAPLVTIAGISAAAAVALRVGGPIAFALYVAYLALGLALGVPDVMTFCERSGGRLGFPDLGRCTVMGYVTSLWPQLVGIGLGVFLTRAVTTRGNGINSLLRIAGAYAVALFVLSHVWAYTVSQAAFTTSQAADALTSSLTLSAGLATAAVAGGVIAAQLPRSIRNAAAVAAISLLPWLSQLPITMSNLGSIPAEFVGPNVVTIVIPPIAAAFLVLSAAVASRARFIPHEAA
jgi:hypothetical protein